jgi:hypothetical protein
MPHPDCYTRFIRDWPTNDGGHMIGDPRKEWRIIPELESEEIQIGSFPHSMTDVLPEMFLDLAAVVAVWEEKHVAVARMHMYGVARTPVRKSKKAIEKLETRSDKLTFEDYYTVRTFLSGSTGIYTRDIFDECIRDTENGYFPANYSYLVDGRLVSVTGCILYIHSQTD